VIAVAALNSADALGGCVTSLWNAMASIAVRSRRRLGFRGSARTNRRSTASHAGNLIRRIL